ncbi:MAG TPA: helix-turn-helix domain-containing protein [Actinospica sp.]|jgi:DNA-binding transcriptional ArsR family regulator|nr:helix-turn-helix domain-containing protein [Actinospica sp.]
MAKDDAKVTESAAEAELEAALPLGPQSLPDLVEFREIDDAATMKALADPLRQRIIRVLGRNVHEQPRIMTVKQLAEELGEPTTKLYRHMKQLLAVNLIQVAELRLVGGIVEQHYRVAQKGWGVHPERQKMDRETLMSDEMLGLAAAGVEEYFTRFETALRTGRTQLRSQDNLDNPPHVRSVGSISDFRMPRERAREFAERFHGLVQEFNAEANERGEDSVHVNLLAVFYATEVDETSES